MPEPQQHPRGDTSASRQGVVVRWLGPLDQRFVIVGSEEKAAGLAILEPVEQHVGQGQTKVQFAVAPTTLQQFQNAIDQECVVIQIGWQWRLTVFINRPQPPIAPHLRADEIQRPFCCCYKIGTVEMALETAGGAGFYRKAELERLFRDIQAARYHPLQKEAQTDFAGAMALGLPTEAIF